MRHFKLKMIKNKKAFIASALVDFYSYILFILLVIIFFMLFSLRSCTIDPAKQEINSYSSDVVELNELMLSYLNSYINIDADHDGVTEYLSIAEFLSYVYLDDTSLLKSNLEKYSADFFDFAREQLPSSSVQGYRVVIIFMPGNEEALNYENYNVIGNAPVASVNAKIPLAKPGNYAIVTIEKESQT